MPGRCPCFSSLFRLLSAVTCTLLLLLCPPVLAQDIDVHVDDQVSYQTMEGFGAALTGSSAWLLMNKLTPEARKTLLESLFDSERGIGLNYLRLPMGSSDFRLKDYTYDDVKPGQLDLEFRHFSIAPDEAEIIPALRAVKSANPEVKIMATPWSAPAWMKEGGKLNGGYLRRDDTTYYTYAGYFIHFLKAYAAKGIPITAVTLQNEPQHEDPSYPTMKMEPMEQAKLARILGRRLKEDGLKTKILLWDHNWDKPEFPIKTMEDLEARPFIDGFSFHAYAGKPDAQSLVHTAFPDKNIYFTEISGGDWSKDFGGNLLWDAENLLVGATKNWAKTVLKWNLALDEKNGPKIAGGADNCRGIITIHSATGQVTKEEDYYALGHLAKFVKPGAKRIGSSHSLSVAFQNPNGSIVLLVYNPKEKDRALNVNWGGRTFGVTLPPRSVTTFVWKNRNEVHSWMTTGDKSKLLEEQPLAAFRF